MPLVRCNDLGMENLQKNPRRMKIRIIRALVGLF